MLPFNFCVLVDLWADSMYDFHCYQIRILYDSPLIFCALFGRAYGDNKLMQKGSHLKNIANKLYQR